MKIHFILICFLQVRSFAQAPSFDEWFRQKKTQIRYYAQQIAALKIYDGFLQDGYGIVENGLNRIGHLKQGDFDQHNSYYNSLRKVNPAIASLPKGAAIYDQINIQIESARQFIRHSTLFSRNDRGYIFNVLEQLREKTEKSELQNDLLTYENNYQLTDAERLKWIQSGINELNRQYAFIKSLDCRLRLMALQKQQEQNDGITEQKILAK